ncbi:MAG: histidine triad nucleotide-binding protein [Candidatus Limnocylindrales bacterium]
MPPDRRSRVDCLFCRIVRAEIPATTIADDDLVLAFHDIAPRSPTHVLVIPKVHIASAADLTDDDGPLLGRMFATLAGIARDAGIAADGYRIVSNVGRWGGQTVDHLHLHLMGGRAFEWPPG